MSVQGLKSIRQFIIDADNALASGRAGGEALARIARAQLALELQGHAAQVGTEFVTRMKSEGASGVVMTPFANGVGFVVSGNPVLYLFDRMEGKSETHHPYINLESFMNGLETIVLAGWELRLHGERVRLHCDHQHQHVSWHSIFRFCTDCGVVTEYQR